MVYSKRGYEFGFTWIFTIIVGAAIIFFAIYFAIQITSTQQTQRDTTEGKSLGILLTPVETEIEEGKFATVYLTDPTRAYFECKLPSSTNQFGSQDLKLSIKPALGQSWDESDSPMVTFHNKYFFPSAETTENEHVFMTEGEKEFYVLSKPLYLPFKIADLIIIYSDKEQYCFDLTGAPADFKDEIQRINMTSVFFQNCDSGKQTTVCFVGAPKSCKITIYPDKVIKNGESLPYLKSSSHDPYSMLYAAIFSDPDTYNCQVRRLMAHTSKLLNIYYSKSEWIVSKPNSNDCSSKVQPIILQFNYSVSEVAKGSIKLTDLEPIMNLREFREDFQNLAGGIGCELF